MREFFTVVLFFFVSLSLIFILFYSSNVYIELLCRYSLSLFTSFLSKGYMLETLDPDILLPH
ncbi:hypothetical protein BCR42DRAFT_427379, partial [Absidia repens]